MPAKVHFLMSDGEALCKRVLNFASMSDHTVDVTCSWCRTKLTQAEPLAGAPVPPESGEDGEDKPYVPQPRQTAVECAQFLREEIKGRQEWLRGLAKRREQVSQRFEAEYEAAPSEKKSDVRTRWGEALREKDREKERFEAELFAYRRTLQYLTGELWS